MKAQLRAIYSQFVVQTCVTSICRQILDHKGAIILVGHQVNDLNDNRLEPLPPAYLEEQLSYLSKHFQFMSLSHLLDLYDQNKEIPYKSIVITFDDGFRDNYTNAFPILKKYNVPATIFLTTDCIETGEMPWSQQLGYMIHHTPMQIISVPELGIEKFVMSQPDSKNKLHSKIASVLSATRRMKRNEFLQLLQSEFEVIPPLDRMLTWEMIREMKFAGIEFGSHTRSHPHLTKLPLDEAREEIQESYDQVKQKLNIEKLSFAFPAGKSNDELIHYVEQVGFRSCFRSSYKHRYNTLESSHPFSLSRLGLPNSAGCFLEAELDSPLYWIKKAFI